MSYDAYSAFRIFFGLTLLLRTNLGDTLKGEITINMAQSPRAAALTALSTIVGQEGPADLDSILSLIDELETNVPNFAKSMQCFSPLTNDSFNCASQSLSQLASDPNQRNKMLEILLKFGWSLTPEKLAEMLAKASVYLIKAAGDEILYINRTVQLRTYPFVKIGISGR
jgi:hypothetical protein